MSTLASHRSHVSFDTDDDTHIGSSSSPMMMHDEALVASSSSPLVPLGPSKTIPALKQRGVIFSPRTDTKYFHSDDLILPSPTNHLTPKVPSSIRSYSDPVTPIDSPSHSRIKAQGQSRNLSDTPLLVRSILKSRVAQQIRLAASVEEGTLNNKEAARLLVSGKRPRLLAKDSFQLALLRNAAADGADANGKGKGKGRMSDDVIPSSDDSNSSTNLPEQPISSEGNEDMVIDGESSEEEEETVEEDGALSTSSLVNIILDGAEDLLTLEEAYNTLTLRLRTRIPVDNDDSGITTTGQSDDFRISTQPIRDEAPAMVRAIQRDLQRLLGKLPNNEIDSSEGDITLFRTLMPLRDHTPTPAGRFTPSPTPGAGPKSSSPTKAARQGYTESEVRYRREASGVGAAVLRFLSFTFHSSHLFSCFSEADLQSLLEQVMAIPRTPKLPTPNPKRSYYLSIVILAQMNIPSACIQPVKDKVVRALEGAMADSLGSMGGNMLSGKEGPSAIKKEGFNAVTNLISNYPTILFPHYSDLLSTCLKGMVNPSQLIRYKSGLAISAFARARFTLLATAQNALMENPTNPPLKENWVKVKTLISKSEFFVISHLKSALKVPGKSAPIYGKDGEKKLEWHSLEQVFKDTVGSTTDVHWACAAWSVMVTLMGSAYASSGLSSGFDHIMDRSLQPSTNVVRPLLARAAWNHAIHAYLSAGFASSISDDGQLIRSYKPFAASSQQTVEQRTANILFPVNLALAKATDKASYARALTNPKAGVESHCIWQRSEKSKKLQWLLTCGLGSTAVVYSYTGIALYHEDQPAKEMSQISGLPSSDGGMVLLDLSPEEAKLPRLDNAWEKVVNPMLRSFFAICGVDKLTIHGWKILEAITSPTIDSDGSNEWNLDKLLIIRYMSGEVFLKEKETDFTDLMNDIQDEEIQPSDIPSWGHFWAAKRLGRLLILFDEALSSINGINDLSSVEWIKNDNDLPIIPVHLSNIWKNLLLALKSAKIAHAPPTPLFLIGLQAVTTQLAQLFNRDPKTYVSISQIDERGRCLLDEDELRIGLMSHQLEVAVEVLGEDILGSIRLRPDQLPSAAEQTTSNIFGNAFGGDANGYPTVAGTLLGQLLRSQFPSVSALQPALQSGFRDLVSRILDIGSSPGYAGKLLGDITNAMPFLFEDCEEIQLDIWRLLATKWTQIIDLQPSSTTSSTNHTGALLVSLLSGPFRGRQITSYWHRQADKSDLEIWQALLKVTVLRFRAKRFGSNCGVLEALAGHLEDFLSEGEKTSSTTITLSCLASAISWMSFTTPTIEGSQSQASPWHISDEGFVPSDFLTLINNALVEAYPVSDSQSETQTKMDYSPAVLELLVNLVKVLEDTPRQLVGRVLLPVKAGLAIWLEDRERVVEGEMNSQLDEVYISLLNTLSSSIPTEELPANSATLNSLAEIYIPRISKASSADVPKTFQSFWNSTFGTSTSGRWEYSEDVAGFLRDLLVAVPGMIVCPGLEGESQISEEESLARFPHILQLPRALSDPIPMDVDVEMTYPEYDADISQSVEATFPQPQLAPQNRQEAAEEDALVDATKESIEPPSPSPLPTHSTAEIMQENEQEDVFGPAALTRAGKSKKGKKGGKRVKGKGKKRESTLVEESMDLQSLPDIKATKVEIPTNSRSLPDLVTPLVEGSDDEDEDCIVVVPSPGYYRRKGLTQPSAIAASQPEPEGENLQDQDAGQDGVSHQHQDVVEGTPTPATSEIPMEELEVPEAGRDMTQIEDTPEVEEEQREPTPIQAELPVQAQHPTVTTTNESPSRPSLLSSASRWLSRVQSFPFFASSPAPSLPPATQPEPEVVQEDVTVSEPEPPASQEQESMEIEAQGSSEKVVKKGRKSRNPRKRRASNVPSAEIVEQPKEVEVVMPQSEPQPVVIKSKESLRKTTSTESIASNASSATTRSKRKRGSDPVDAPAIQPLVVKEEGKDRKGKRKAAVIEVDSAMEVQEEEPRRSKRRKSKNASIVIDSVEIPQSHSPARTQSQTQSQLPAPARDDSPVQSQPEQIPIVIDDDDEDELLLSPESARRRKREEDELVRASQSRSQWSESISGRFDDAPGDSSFLHRPSLTRIHSSNSSIRSNTPSPTASSSTPKSRSKARAKDQPQYKGDIKPSPNKRNTQQTKILNMLDEAVRSKQVIENLDYAGVKALLRNLNELREVGERRLYERMEELRGAK
ncbi:hypothetical protein I302_106863 [Kwoniella bestiolae CBS 10118]|uniref:Telomere-associated protein Rif1 N-terminal domain-containing protein n=1 Tax=Kwoniella bestiolae CBS 10118 TaxID=1296100 RepID=A0A1B9G063_9TREE|nr:hypothetical protein I302_05871 [Kwoniella bestiolae CBS 10118]OCF24411.1 hypothetical protein I302_05871 [Kwoniella bestiolae CBS 10118]